LIAEEIELDGRRSDDTTALGGADEPVGAEPVGAEEQPVLVGFLLRARPAAVYVAVAVVGIGFALIAMTWGLVAGTVEVARQLPYVISGGLSGLGLVIVGTGLLIIVIRSRESAARRAQYEELASLLRSSDTSSSTRRGRR
jgi:hypothetical protein